MSVIKVSSNEKVPHVIMEREVISSAYNTTESSHKIITKKMANEVINKNMLKINDDKKQSKQKSLSILLPAALLPIQQISQLNNLAKAFVTLKENVCIGDSIQTVEKNNELNISSIEFSRNNNVFIEGNISVDHHILDNLPNNHQFNIANKLTSNINEKTNLQDDSLIVNQNDIIQDLSKGNNIDINPLAHLTTAREIEPTHELTFDNNLPIVSAISVEKKMADEDEIPLLNTMMVSFPLQDIPLIAKEKFNNSLVQHKKDSSQPSENIQFNAEESLVEFTSRRTLASTTKEPRSQTKKIIQQIDDSAKTAIKPRVEREISEEQSKQYKLINNQLIDLPENTQLLNNNRLKDEPLKSSFPVSVLQLVNPPLNDQRVIKQSMKDSTQPVNTQFELTFADNELLIQPFSSQEIITLSDNKQVLLSEKSTNYYSDEIQGTTAPVQNSVVEERDASRNIMVTVFNEVMRPSVSSQAMPQSQGTAKMPEQMGKASLLGENNQPKTASRSLTYTFNHWQSSPSVTFELASKGEFIALTPSQEVQQALNENKHLLSHESRVYVQREDERQQHRSRQQYDQQQEED